MPYDDRPREKLMLHGAQALSDSELLAIILRTGTKGKSVLTIAQEIIKKAGNLALLATKSVDNLKKNAGIGKDKAATLAAAFELSRRIDSEKKWFSNIIITSPADVLEIFLPVYRDLNKEKFSVVCLNSANKVIKYEVISTGNLNSSIVHPREVFKVAIDNDSANIILFHNHPSGNVKASNEDIKITKQIVQAGKILGIQVFDHIILAGNNYFSFFEERII